MRLQLAVPQNTFLGPDIYNQFFTTHGTTMMFLFAVPVMEGMGLYLVPLMVGTRNVCFPAAAELRLLRLPVRRAAALRRPGLQHRPGHGLVQLRAAVRARTTRPGKRVDVWSQMVTLVEISTLVGAVEIIATVVQAAGPGHVAEPHPAVRLGAGGDSFMIIFAMPAVMLCSTMLATDRLTKVSTHFFNPAEGGDPLLWQHLFWFFAHPEVYIIFLPATGFVSAIIPTFTRRTMFGYTALVLSLIATAFIGFGVWVHHMFATPLPRARPGDVHRRRA